MIKLIQGDCLEKMRDIPDGSVDLILTDPPYNIKKADWDKWKCKHQYAEWLVDVFALARKKMKDNGSFYFFHNDFLQIVNIQNLITEKTDLVFKQLITWNKKYEGVYNEGFLQGFIVPEGLRNYQQMTEFILFYTLQDETGLKTIMLDENNFTTLREYSKTVKEFIGLSLPEINKRLSHRKSEHFFYFNSTQWGIGLESVYDEMVRAFSVEKMDGYRTYESLRQEYESLRYTFNNQKTHHSVWNYPIAKKQGHITPKPVDLIENILKHSSNEGDVVLDCFMGSGSTGVACVNLNRNFIGIEKDDKYFEIAEKRINENI